MGVVSMFECDGCEARKEFAAKNATTPAGWFRLTVFFVDGAGISRTHRLAVCSPACSAKALDALVGQPSRAG